MEAQILSLLLIIWDLHSMENAYEFEEKPQASITTAYIRKSILLIKTIPIRIEPRTMEQKIFMRYILPKELEHLIADS